MDKAQQETCVDTGLALGLSVSRANIPALKNNSVPIPNSSEPSLTLSISESMHTNLLKTEPETSKHNYTAATGISSPPHSAVSVFSAGYIHGVVKKERETAGEALSNNSNSRVSDQEDEDGGTRKKLRLTKEQSALLEDRFKEHTTLNPKQKQALAKQLNLRPRQVEVWFQNRRARTKLKQTEVDCEFLKRCCETLTEENRRLQKELQELKALKFAPPPLYMQFPAATLTLCPSCERIGGAGSTDSQDRDGSKPATGSAPFKSHFFNPFTHSAAC
ncbi:Homeobox associated leucine zipper protein [Rhynchospora pubera]|uniref:Homeobox associated leucine zipper protein n=1 Tax=Rhynchospora pubera TaxID=906938 RepID=A0AAV8C8L7_9POAL|nr:Homeobox associated leucine zipper protein [Rhynchospora pubera]